MTYFQCWRNSSCWHLSLNHLQLSTYVFPSPWHLSSFWYLMYFILTLCDVEVAILTILHKRKWSREGTRASNWSTVILVWATHLKYLLECKLQVVYARLNRKFAKGVNIRMAFKISILSTKIPISLCCDVPGWKRKKHVHRRNYWNTEFVVICY